MAQLFGEKLRTLRHLRALTQVTLAEQLGLASYTHITKLEAGQDAPSLALALRIAQALNVTTDYLLRDTIPSEDAALATVPAKVGDSGAEMFGARLRAMRLQNRLTQAELSQRLGLARQGYISNLESGRKMPSLELVVQIADLFGVTTDALLRGEQAA